MALIFIRMCNIESDFLFNIISAIWEVCFRETHANTAIQYSRKLLPGLSKICNHEKTYFHEKKRKGERTVRIKFTAVCTCISNNRESHFNDNRY